MAHPRQKENLRSLATTHWHKTDKAVPLPMQMAHHTGLRLPKSKLQGQHNSMPVFVRRYPYFHLGAMCLLRRKHHHCQTNHGQLFFSSCSIQKKLVSACTIALNSAGRDVADKLETWQAAHHEQSEV